MLAWPLLEIICFDCVLAKCNSNNLKWGMLEWSSERSLDAWKLLYSRPNSNCNKFRNEIKSFSKWAIILVSQFHFSCHSVMWWGWWWRWLLVFRQTKINKLISRSILLLYSFKCIAVDDWFFAIHKQMIVRPWTRCAYLL